MDESGRIRKLRREIVAMLPKFPNDRQTQSELEEMPLSSLLLHYLSWMSRFVSVRPRNIEVVTSLLVDQRWIKLRPQLEFLLNKALAGEDLAPHLSLQAMSRGYTPAASRKGAGDERWADKDFLLNAMGYHHFHLGMRLETKGHIERSNDVLFAKVDRNSFTAIGIFDHSVFESSHDTMTDERTRLWQVYDTHARRGVQPGSVVLSGLLSTSGHPLHIVGTAGEYARVIWQVDRQLDDLGFVRQLYQDARLELPRKSKFEWVLNFSDLMIHELKSNSLFMVRRGFN